jgi:hypothetical protein
VPLGVKQVALDWLESQSTLVKMKSDLLLAMILCGQERQSLMFDSGTPSVAEDILRNTNERGESLIVVPITR